MLSRGVNMCEQVLCFLPPLARTCENTCVLLYCPQAVASEVLSKDPLTRCGVAGGGGGKVRAWRGLRGGAVRGWGWVGAVKCGLLLRREVYSVGL